MIKRTYQFRLRERKRRKEKVGNLQNLPAERMSSELSSSRSTKGSHIPGFPPKLVRESRECFLSPVGREDTEKEPQPLSVLIMQRRYSASTTSPHPSTSQQPPPPPESRQSTAFLFSFFSFSCKGSTHCASWGPGARSDLGK